MIQQALKYKMLDVQNKSNYGKITFQSIGNIAMKKLYNVTI